ncbi:DUF3016 domain-containing protein [Dyella sp. A6]|uniref:DUF3016 domain-containing protein n=1 Tax=Dyella aluminiiresistens TaxID=3069105 RepID=UPI002E78571C|nr:DUF3016 domain-containing protein [Dyella sp. A6]
MKSRFVMIAPLLAALVLGGTAMAATTTTPNTVSVTYDHPENFSEAIKERSFAPSRESDTYLKTLRVYMEKRAARILPPGERLDIVVTDIDLAGSFEPWHGIRMQDVRIIRSIYPPRIDLHFRLLGADGKVLREGTRKLRDPGFLDSGITTMQNTPLIYEKVMIDRWLRKGPDKL